MADLSDLKLKLCKDVYEPREDSYMLANVVSEHAFGRVLDIGTGSGIQGITAAKRGCSVTFLDIDPKAVDCAKSNANLNNIRGNFICSDMFDKINEKFDTIIFNPPYVASKEKLHLALDGGE